MAVNNLKEKIQNIIHLPALPAIAMEVISIIENPRTNVQTLSNLISKDQVLASKILKIANSPFYGYSKTISTLDFAIVILGFDTLKDAVLSVALISHLNKNVSKDFDMNAFWSHSMATSIIARELAKYLNYKTHATESFVAGLIHDLGILILNQYFRKEFEEVMDILRSGNATILEAERKVFGTTHDEIGSWLAQRWNFPKALIEAIKFHHNPTYAVIDKQLSVIIHFADVLAQGIESCEFILEKGVKIYPGAVEIVKQNDEEFLNVFMRNNEAMINAEITKIRNFIST
jgi:putative nucleotidyltransferase with HDIG domain